ncbi:hypothetical protein EYF80_022880 [Liparis tanakae]|uniref:Uncharacterized protein n=1 Tax=Liparis tanakae TaxID=230148 RepID=A0A4Z2HMP2_9TELE|nr:hypothetical protein EYF80_022880 [Liparis tanakae]
MTHTHTLYLWDVDSGPEELQVLPHLLRFELGVEDGELGEHAHVGALQPQRRLQQRDELLVEPAVLIVADQVLQLVGVDHDVEAADLPQTKLLAVHAREAHLAATSRNPLPARYLLPRPRAVGFAGAVHGRLVLPEVDQRRRQAGEVGHVVVQELGRLVHPVIITTVAHLRRDGKHDVTPRGAPNGGGRAGGAPFTCWMWALLGPLTNSSSSARRFVFAKAKISSVSTRSATGGPPFLLAALTTSMYADGSTALMYESMASFTSSLCSCARANWLHTAGSSQRSANS